jgi:hypothetical protein
MRNTLFTIVTALGCAVLAVAQPAPAGPPDVQGLWKCVFDQSDFGPNPTPSKLSLDMKSDGAVLKVRQDSDDGVTDFTFRTDGAATTNSLPDGSEMNSHYAWQNGVLAGEHVIGAIKLKDRISVSADGKRMTLDREIENDGGNARMHVVLERSVPAKPSMAGLWKLDAAKSDFGGPMPSRFEASITVDGPVISMTQTTDQGVDRLNVRDDGQETVNETNGLTMKSKMWWERDVLVGEHVYTGRNFEMTMRDRTAFSPDGRVMTMDRVGNTPGGAERKMHIVMVKQ